LPTPRHAAAVTLAIAFCSAMDLVSGVTRLYKVVWYIQLVVT